MDSGNKKWITAPIVLNIVWGIITIVLLTLALYLNWQYQHLKTRQALNNAAEEVRLQFDGFITGVLQSIYALPIYSEAIKQCEPDIRRRIQHVIFNNPEISGLIVKDKNNQIICTTVAKHEITPLLESSLALYGPIKLGKSDKPAFLIQQRLGNYFVGVYVVKPVIERKLQASSPIAKHVALYDAKNKKVVSQITRKNHSKQWYTRDNSHFLVIYPLDESAKQILATKKSQHFKNFHIVTLANPKEVNIYTWYLEGLIVLLILGASFGFYYYLRQIMRKRFSLQRAMQHAIKNKNFFPLYQPLFDSNKNAYCGAEILIRWQTDSSEVIMPDSFIEEAEQTGLIIPITLQLAEKVFRECKPLLDAYPDFHLAFNLSAEHFSDNSFFDDFIQLIKKCNIPIKQLMLELTERDLLDETEERLIKKITELRQAGFSLAIDDFGTGHASINYLQHFPFNYLKIDKLFIQAIGTGAITATLNEAIIHMAKNLKLNIIAEGVETQSQLDFLQAHGVTLMQGWYFAAAMPIDKLKNIVKGNNE